MAQDDAIEFGADESGDPVYSYKPSLFGAPWEFCLRPDALEWRAGHFEGRTPYTRMTRVRLSFRPMTMQSRRFLTEIWSSGAPRLSIASSSWQSVIQQSSQIEAYGAFIRELHRRMAAAGSKAHFNTGSPGWLYWPGLAIFAGISIAIVVLTVRTLLMGEWMAAALIGGFFAVFGWQMGTFFRLNRPRPYSPGTVPAELVPPR
jgi:hypothetical protein